MNKVESDVAVTIADGVIKSIGRSVVYVPTPGYKSGDTPGIKWYCDKYKEKYEENDS